VAAKARTTKDELWICPDLLVVTIRGWLARLSQVCYGVELVSASDIPETFAFTGFSVSR